MKKGDCIWGLLLLVWIIILVIPASRDQFISTTAAHPYIGGFVKFAILASMGDLLGTRIVKGNYFLPKGFVFRAVIWGIIGLMVTLVFSIFMGGTAAAQAEGKLPFEGIASAQAFFGSAIMNLTFGPMMMVFHRFTDLYLDSIYENGGSKVTISGLVDKVDWHSLVEFSWIKTCPYFWIPAHTIVFLLPGEYRVLVSAFLSIALGLLLAFAKKGKVASSSVARAKIS